MSVKETMTDDYLGTISAAMVRIELFFFYLKSCWGVPYFWFKLDI